ncbi:CBO0543 family protein [Lederbergia wuyishanensis]
MTRKLTVILKVTTVKHWRNSNSPLWQKTLFLNRHFAYIVIIVFAALFGSGLDLFFVKYGFYEFPFRPFPHLFSINIAFTLCVLPFITFLYLVLMKKMNRLERWIVILIISFLAPLGEIISEAWGLFIHSEKWSHYYSVIGYFLYLVFVSKIFFWLSEKTLRN